MTGEHVLGAVILLVVFGAIFTVMVLDIGWVGALCCWVGTIALTAAILYACSLLGAPS
jgi:hypothetical protein